MKATGIIRRTDELGRIVIPKEIRTRLHICENDSFEFYLDREGRIILEKYIFPTPENLIKEVINTLEDRDGFDSDINYNDLNKSLYGIIKDIEKGKYNN